MIKDLLLVFFTILAFGLIVKTFSTVEYYSEECDERISERVYFNGQEQVHIWEIDGEDYLVKDKEIVGRFSRYQILSRYQDMQLIEKE